MKFIAIAALLLATTEAIKICPAGVAKVQKKIEADFAEMEAKPDTKIHNKKDKKGNTVKVIFNKGEDFVGKDVTKPDGAHILWEQEGVKKDDGGRTLVRKSVIDVPPKAEKEEKKEEAKAE